jgi:hypothetical protein
MIVHPQYRNVEDAIAEGVRSFKKWYRKVDDTSDAYFICLGRHPFLPFRHSPSDHTILPVLDPNVKDLYCRHRWETDQFDAGMRRLGEVVREILNIIFDHCLMEHLKFDKYYTPPAIPTTSKSVTTQSDGTQKFLTHLRPDTNTQLVK